MRGGCFTGMFFFDSMGFVSSNTLHIIALLVIAPLVVSIGGGMEVILFIPSAILLVGILVFGLFGASNQNKDTFLFVILVLLCFRVLIPVVPFDDKPELWIVTVPHFFNQFTGGDLSLCYGSDYYCYKYVQQDFYNIFWKSLLVLLTMFIVVVVIWGSRKIENSKTKMIFRYINPANYALELFLVIYLIVTLFTLLPYAHQQSIKDGGRQRLIEQGIREYFKSHPDSRGVLTGYGANGDPIVDGKIVY